MRPIIRLKQLAMPLALASLFLASSCDKDDDNNIPEKTAMLSANSWIAQSITADPAYDWFGDGNPITDIYAIFPPCSKDDFTTFRANGVIIHDEGSSKCFEQDPQTKQGAWIFKNGETVISVTEGGTTEDWKIVKLDATELIVEYAVTEDGGPYTFTIVYRKK